jgi:ferredoxin
MTETHVLKRSKDRKVANAVTPNGKSPKIANAFGLPSGKPFSCPGATSVCETVCYAGKLEKIYKGVKNVLVSNWENILYVDYLFGVYGMTDLLANMMEEFVEECEKKGASKDFRIHWDGDFFSIDYAKAWAMVAKAYPDVHFWVYTRSFTPEINVIPVISGIDNLTVYLSVDSDNLRYAKNVRAEYPDVKWAWLAKDFKSGRAEMPELGKRYDCPENKGSIPLINEKGSACIRCGICVEGRGDVIFSVSKK